MESREILFEKIQNKRKEWESQLKDLKSKAEGFDYDSRMKIQKQIEFLNTKFKEVENKAYELRTTTPQEIGDKAIQTWLELLSKIDSAMSKLKK